MLSALRKHTLLPLLLSMGLLLSAAGPLLQPICAMSQMDGHGSHHSTSEPIHSSDQTPPCIHENGGMTHATNLPCPSSDTLQCCTLEATPAVEEALFLNHFRNDLQPLSDSPTHKPFEKEVLRDFNQRHSQKTIPPLPAVDRQALLLIFLI